MLKRLYIDNYRCLVNLDLHFGRRSLFLGLNGTGKSTVFDVLKHLCALTHGDAEVNDRFPTRSQTRWQHTDQQTFELELDSDTPGEDFRYTLQIEHSRTGAKSRVKKERLQRGSILLFDRDYAEAQLYRDNGSVGPKVLSDWNRSSLYQINPRPDNSLLTQFKRKLERIANFQLNPWLMSGKSEKEEVAPDSGLSNFASWYRHLLLEKSRAMNRLQDDLKGVFGDSFEGLRMVTQGESRTLVADVRVGASGQTISYEFKELSEGQRVLIGLYTLVHAMSGEGATLCLDEADNFVALKEIQPWLNCLEEQADLQILLISHHPEIIDQYAPSHGLHFRRGEEGPVRVEPFHAPPGETLTAAQLVARGWDLGAA